jgi:hypothetical protein
MSTFEELDKQDIQIEDADEPRQVWIRVRDAEKLILPENPKRHDMGALISSIVRYGFQEVAKYDATVGGVKAGNGRIEALGLMEREGRPVPRGIAVERETGAWVMPMTIGVDARSRSEAFTYLIDSNNLVMAGGDLDGFDMARLWDASYVKLLEGLDELPVSVDPETLGALMALPGFGDEPLEQPDAPEDFPEYGDDIEVQFRCPKCGYEWSGSPS